MEIQKFLLYKSIQIFFFFWLNSDKFFWETTRRGTLTLPWNERYIWTKNLFWNYKEHFIKKLIFFLEIAVIYNLLIWDSPCFPTWVKGFIYLTFNCRKIYNFMINFIEFRRIYDFNWRRRKSIFNSHTCFCFNIWHSFIILL